MLKFKMAALGIYIHISETNDKRFFDGFSIINHFVTNFESSGGFGQNK